MVAARAPAPARAGAATLEQPMRLLLVEDNARFAGSLARGLVEEGFTVDTVGTGAAAIVQIARDDLDAIILDLGLPDVDGTDVLARLRADGSRCPVLVLTARDAVAARVAALDAGADDYLVKPFAFDELLARLRALGRRGRTRQLSGLLTYGPLTVDPVAHQVTAGGQLLSLTATEYRLLEFLVRRAEAIVSRDQLAEHVWGGDYDPFSNVADVYVGYVRRKLQAALPHPLIHTVRGLGYMLKQEHPAPAVGGQP
jgi:DNA-binding response OmpR family regulator